MGAPKPPKMKPVAAAAKMSSLDIQRSQMESEEEMRRRRGFDASTFAGAPSPNALG